MKILQKKQKGMLNCVIHILLFAPLIATSCDSDYIEFKSSCYFISFNSTKFAAAELVCRESGGHLASIHDPDTNSFIAQQALTNESDLWIGLTNLKDPSSWKWTDNTDLDYQNWNNESSLNIINKNCAAFSFTDDAQWYAEDCYKTKSFLCQRSDEPLCENGFVYFPATKSCYGGSANANWTHAEENCTAKFNAHLPWSESFAEFQFLASYAAAVAQPYWVGIRFSNESQTWITVDGSEADFVNWCPGYPQQETEGRCVATNYMCYVDEDCGVQHMNLCKKEANIDFRYRSCPSSFIEWNSKCYFVSQNKNDYNSAESHCIEMGGHLASIHDGFENAVISQLGETPDVWIGLSNFTENWEWLDNSSLNYENWKEIELSNSSDLNCVSTYLADGKWIAGDCEIEKPYICEIEYQVPNCSDGWFYFIATDACYGDGEITRDRRGYNYSLKYCTALGANLPSIHSKYEFQLIRSYAYWYAYWLGIRTFDGGKTWEADDGSAADFLEYAPWCNGFPSGSSDEQCVILQPFNDGAGCYDTMDCPNGTSHGAFSICQKQVTTISTTNNPILSSKLSTTPISTYKVSATTLPFSLSTTTIESTTATTSQFGEHQKSSNILWYIGGSAVIIIAIIILTIWLISHLKRRNRQKQLDELFRKTTCMNEYVEHFDVKLEIDELEINFFNVLGRGSNSIVYKAHLKNGEKRNVKVAVIIPISFEKEDIMSFQLELDAYVKIGSHPHIITFYGWILYQNAPAIVSELATQNLLMYVRSLRRKPISTINFIKILSQISQALKHVAALNIVHRDVACRNILMITDDYVKLADFGLCCECNNINETYYAVSRKKLPVKWLSIEALTERKFSEKSDVWAFGILCYEMFSCGNEPYSSLSNDEMLEFLQSGKRLMIPRDTPEPISSIMVNCWNENLHDRNTFAVIEQSLRRILEDDTAKYGYIVINENVE